VADKKITELAAIDAVQPTDLLVVVDDPGGTPITKKATVSQVAAAGGGFDPAANQSVSGIWDHHRVGTPADIAIRVYGPDATATSQLIYIGTTNYGNQGVINVGSSLMPEGSLNVARKVALRHDGGVFLSRYMSVLWATNDDATSLAPDTGLYRKAPRTLRVFDGAVIAGGDFSTVKGGGLIVGDTAANSPRPTADAAHRGMIWTTWGAAGVTDTFEVCLKSAADTYSWVPIVTGG
jgi:hypothetical protein